ncbi:MAG: 57, gp57 [Achromobacter mucicolens]|nr:57, gp57 [Achromobacter mucicolens]
MTHRKWPLLRRGMLLVLVLSAAGCSSASTRWLAPQQVAIPPLPTEARQGPTPSICSPTCSAGLASELERLQKLRTEPASPD